MGLTAAQIEAHIKHWEGELGKTYRSYRDKWPSRLFHHAPLENAANILTSGRLLSRTGVQNLGVKDVASQAVVQNNSAAHGFGRMYFRPRTPTQFHIEGVRKDAECFNNELTAHAPILVMLVFSARSVLSLEGTNFSTGNMQSSWTTYGPTFEDFQQIDFQKVYHEGGTSGDHSIVTARCAEVLVSSPLPLQGNLQFILCRSQAERQTLLYALGANSEQWVNFVRVSDDIQVFQKEYCYVEEASISTRGVTLRLHPRADDAPILVQVEAVRASTGHKAAQFGPAPLRAVPGGGKTQWLVEGTAALRPGDYDVRIWLEGHLAFASRLSIVPAPF
jgi:hypothetical protein